MLFATGQMGAGGGEEESKEDRENAAELEQERLEALREAEERRKEKHMKMEAEREKMRQGIRDKVSAPPLRNCAISRERVV